MVDRPGMVLISGFPVAGCACGVRRIELAARPVPRGFPLDTVQSAIDYDGVLIGGEKTAGNKFLLPVHFAPLSRERGGSLYFARHYAAHPV